jgi:lipoprotein NlpI
MRTQRFDKAISDLNRLVQINPNNPYAYINRGTAYQGCGNYGSSIDDFNQALKIAPRIPMIYFNRGISWKALGNFERAIADQAQAIALFPDFADAHGELGVVYQLKRLFDPSIASLTTAINLAPSAPIHLKNRGLTLYYQGDFEAAAIDLRRALDLASDTYTLLFLYLARTKAGHDAVAELATRAAKLRNRTWPVAIVELYLGRLTAEAALAAAATPDEAAEAQFYLGEWHLMRHDRVAAESALRRAVQSLPTLFSEFTGAVVALERLERGTGSGMLNPDRM